MEEKTSPRKPGYYLIKIPDYDKEANRIDDKWSVAHWDGKCFEELNEMYYEGDCIEIKKTPILEAVNYHDRLVEALEALMSECNIETISGVSAYEKAKSLLKELKQPTE